MPSNFRDHMNDASKVQLAEEFVQAVQRLAVETARTEDQVWTQWNKYALDCQNFDQSPTLPEFERGIRNAA